MTASSPALLQPSEITRGPERDRAPKGVSTTNQGTRRSPGHAPQRPHRSAGSRRASSATGTSRNFAAQSRRPWRTATRRARRHTSRERASGRPTRSKRWRTSSAPSPRRHPVARESARIARRTVWTAVRRGRLVGHREPVRPSDRVRELRRRALPGWSQGARPHRTSSSGRRRTASLSNCSRTTPMRGSRRCRRADERSSDQLRSRASPGASTLSVGDGAKGRPNRTCGLPGLARPSPTVSHRGTKTTCTSTERALHPRKRRLSRSSSDRRPGRFKRSERPGARVLHQSRPQHRDP